MTVCRWLDLIPPDKDETGPWNAALNLIGEFVPECDKCCTAATCGDICESCAEVHAHIALGIQFARDERRERG